MIREVTKNNLPILFAFWPVIFVAAKGEYFNMHLMSRLEYKPKFSAIMGGLFFVNPLNLNTDDLFHVLDNKKDGLLSRQELHAAAKTKGWHRRAAPFLAHFYDFPHGI